MVEVVLQTRYKGKNHCFVNKAESYICLQIKKNKKILISLTKKHVETR